MIICEPFECGEWELESRRSMGGVNSGEFRVKIPETQKENPLAQQLIKAETGSILGLDGKEWYIENVMQTFGADEVYMYTNWSFSERPPVTRFIKLTFSIVELTAKEPSS